jgi:hypothetical protein
MTYVAAAYLVTVAILVMYAATIWLRQRQIRRRHGDVR